MVHLRLQAQPGEAGGLGPPLGARKNQPGVLLAHVAADDQGPGLEDGHEDPFAALSFLAEKGYRYVTFYGSMGYLIFSADLASAGATNFIMQILRWAHSTGGYFDILAFHASAQELHEEFCEREKNTFPPINRL